MLKNLYERRTFVSIHAPAKGATYIVDDLLVDIRFQSTLPRRERLVHTRTFLTLLQVSIHAPAKGATFKYSNPVI